MASSGKQYDIAASQPALLPRQSGDRITSSFKSRTSNIRSPLPRRRVSMDLPERLRFNEEEDENVDDGTGLEDGFPARSMYGMLAATQGKPISRPRVTHQEIESESEGEDDGDKRGSTELRRPSKEASRPPDIARRSGDQDRTPPPQPENSDRKQKAENPVNKLARSVFGRTQRSYTREGANSRTQDPMTQSQILPPKGKGPIKEVPSTLGSSDAPVLGRKLEAVAQAELDSSTSTLTSRHGREGKVSEDGEQRKTNRSLPKVIADIFKFVEPEEVTSEFRCWYLANVLLQGYLYITVKHVCFYAYLHKKTGTTIKSGHLSTIGLHSYRYRRYWFVLKGDTFSYYDKPSEPYAANGFVDLRKALSVEHAVVPGKDETASDFTITTPDRVFQYRAETPSSAKDWVKQIQQVMFRTHNDGDSVKICLPIESIVNVERTEVIDFAETLMVRVVDNEETYAVDEYFFTFFQRGEEAAGALIALTPTSHANIALAEESRSPISKHRSPAGRSRFSTEQSFRLEALGSTLTPLCAAARSNSGSRGETRGPQRASDQHGRVSSGRGRRRTSIESEDTHSAFKSHLSPSLHESTESFVTSSGQPDSSIDGDGDAMETDMSASQMLSDDHVFRGPTLRIPQPRRTAPEETARRLRRESMPSSRESSRDREAVVRASFPSQMTHDDSFDRQRPAAQRMNSGDSVRAEAKEQAQPEASAPKLSRAISTPLQHAINVAGAVRAGIKTMPSYLSSSPQTYIANWQEAMAGGKRHYTGVEGLAPDDSIGEPDQDLDYTEHERRFQSHFGLPATEKLVSVFYCWLHKTVPLWGKIYMGTRRLCFRSLYYGTSTKLIIPYKDIVNVQKKRGFRWGHPGMVLVIRGYEELFFDFQDTGLRDDCVVSTIRIVEDLEAAAESTILTVEEQQDATEAAAENALLRAARQDGHADQDNLDLADELYAPPIIFDAPPASVLEFKPKKSLNITCLTIGSRGDVQPYIALCKGLLAEGHNPTIATHAEFRGWVEKHGIAFREVGGDPAELMRICVENGMFTPSFFYESHFKFRSWLDELLVSSWAACQGADLIIESPSAMSGIHIAEALKIPYFRAFTMPWTRTRAYPHAFSPLTQKQGGAYNYMTYTLFDNVFFAAISGQINRWRGKTLKLPPTSLDRLQQNKVPFLYNFSPSVVPRPLDFSDWIKVTGYWFLDEGEGYTPREELAAFIRKARDDDQKLVYIGFGSVTVSDSRQLMQQIVEAVVKADVRCILSKGWSDRFETASSKSLPPLVLPSCIHQIQAAPHDWLFKQVDAVVHHGGAGTTGASLRCGVPTIIKPFFGDQFFFATRVEDLGVGIHLKKVTANQLGKALWYATHDERMRMKAKLLGEAIQSEDGVDNAIKSIWRDMDYAKSLIKKNKVHVRAGSIPSDGGHEDSEDTEENWTFVDMDGEAAATETGTSDALAMELGAARPPLPPDALSQQSSPASPSGRHSKNPSLGDMIMRGGRS